MRLCVVSHAYVMQPGYLPVLQSMAAVPGVELALITPDVYGGGRFDKRVFRNPNFSFQTHPIPIRLGGRQGTFHYRRAHLQQALNAFQPDILLHDQEVYSFGAAQIAAIASRRGLPLAMFVWENVPRKLSPPRRSLSRFVLNRCDGLLAGSLGAEKIHRDWGFRGPIQVVPQMGVPDVDASPRFGRRDPECFRVVFAGRLVPEKGVDCLIRAVARAHAKGLAIQCTIAGDGPEIARLGDLVQSLQVENIVALPGLIPLDEVPSLLNRSDVLVLPSRRTTIWEEQFGRILVEAMAKTTVTVGSRTGAIPEVIGIEDLLFEENDDTALAELLFSLATQPNLFEQYQHKLWQRAQDLYTNDVLSRKRIAFLSGLIEAKRSLSR